MYVFDNASRHTETRFASLEGMFDAGTIRHLEARGVREGWQCLEVGGGGGSIATWLVQRVGLLGRVLTTDLDTRYIEQLRVPGLEVLQHRIEVDPVPTAAFDLVHARLVLMHLPERAAALAKLAAALKPGGWLVVEDFEIDSREQGSKTLAAMRRVMERRGVDLEYGRRLATGFLANGLEEVDAEGTTRLWRGGSRGAAMVGANYAQLRDEILRSGFVSTQEFEDDVARLADRSWTMRSPTLWTAWGRRPTGRP